MKYIRFVPFVAAAMFFASCEQEFYRPDEEVLILDNKEYPQVNGYVTAGTEAENVEVMLRYENGLGRTVDVEILNTIGLYSENVEVTLEQEDGTIVLPLKGRCDMIGIQDLKARVHYDVYNVFSPFRIGVRPETISPLRLTEDPVMSGGMYTNIMNESCKIRIGYADAWSRAISVRFESEAAGVGTEEKTYRPALDNEPGSFEVLVPCTPEKAGKLDFKMFVKLEDDEQVKEFSFTADVVNPIEYVEEEVSHTIIVTDRNDIKTDADIKTAKFTYKTVFVDMNGDGYVSGNHEIWLDRNVGATSCDPASTDSYGFIYQGARALPGYIANSQNGGYCPGEKYKAENTGWFNFNSTQVSLGDVNGTSNIILAPMTIGPSNPCPKGFRMPTQAEFNLLVSFIGTAPADYAGSVLHLSLPGTWVGNNAGSITGVGTHGYYWTRPVNGGQIATLQLTETMVNVKNSTKGSGCSIRCIKANPEEIRDYSYTASDFTDNQ